ncbi:MAG: DUF1573 domain-containing protein [Flavobacteriia bacterium]|jgi:hypothetical protein
MKLVLAIIFISLNSALALCQVAEFSFKKSSHKFQKIKAGEVITHYYVFTNTGKTPLIIDSYEVACHCTVIDFPRYPIAPGKTDSLKLTFNSKGKYGNQDREIVLFANTKHKETSLRFKVFVEGKKEE